MSAPTSPPTSRRSKQKLIECKVLLLDNTTLNVPIPMKSTGQVLYDDVIGKLQLLEADYFDLQYTDLRNIQYWLDHDKPILRQCPRQNLDFRFLVKFYTPDPGLLEDDYTRYLFALQLRRDLAAGSLPCQEHTAILLASYAVQSELGDFSDELALPGYLREVSVLPNQTEELEQKIAEHHRDHVGQTPAEADFNLLDTARKIDLYGIQMHLAKDHEGVPLHLAVAHLGVLVFQNQTKINTFSWAMIRKLSFKRKKFLVKLHPEGSGFYKGIVEFFFESRNDCKTFWKKCVEHHAFFRCQSVKRLPRNKTRLVSCGSSFRYSGRTQKQLAEYVRENYGRKSEFQRSSSMRTLSHSAAATPKVGTLKSKDHHLSHPNIRTSNSSHAICLERALAREKYKQGRRGDMATSNQSQTVGGFQQRSQDQGRKTLPRSCSRKSTDEMEKLRKKALRSGTVDDFNCSYFKDGNRSIKNSTDNLHFHDNMSQDSYRLTESRDSLDADQVESAATNQISEESKKLADAKDNGIEQIGEDKAELTTENVTVIEQNDLAGEAGFTENVQDQVAETAEFESVELENGLQSPDACVEHENLNKNVASLEESKDVSEELDVSGVLMDDIGAVYSLESQKRKRLSRGEAIQEAESPIRKRSSSESGLEYSNAVSNVAFISRDNGDVVPSLLARISSEIKEMTELCIATDVERVEKNSVSESSERKQAEVTQTLLPLYDSEKLLSNDGETECVVEASTAETKTTAEKPTENRETSQVADKKLDFKETKSATVNLSGDEKVVTNMDAEFPYVLHKRLITSRGEQTDDKAFSCPKPTLSLRSRSLSPGKKPLRTQQRAELEKVKAALSAMTSPLEKRSPGTKRVLDFVMYNKLPPRDSFSCRDDSVSPTVLEKAILAKWKRSDWKTNGESGNVSRDFPRTKFVAHDGISELLEERRLSSSKVGEVVASGGSEDGQHGMAVVPDSIKVEQRVRLVPEGDDKAIKSVLSTDEDSARPVSGMEKDAEKHVLSNNEGVAKTDVAVEEDTEKCISTTEEAVAKPDAATEVDAEKCVPTVEEDVAKLDAVTEKDAEKLVSTTEEDVAQPDAATETDTEKCICATKEDVAKPDAATEADAEKCILTSEETLAKPDAATTVDAEKCVFTTEEDVTKLDIVSEKDAEKQVFTIEENFPQPIPLAERNVERRVSITLKDVVKPVSVAVHLMVTNSQVKCLNMGTDSSLKPDSKCLGLDGDASDDFSSVDDYGRQPQLPDDDNDADFELDDLPPPPSLEASTSSLEKILMNVDLPPPPFDNRTDLFTSNGSTRNCAFKNYLPDNLEFLILPPPPPPPAPIHDDKSLPVELFIHEPVATDLPSAVNTTECPVEVLHDHVLAGDIDSIPELRLPGDPLISMLTAPLPPPFPYCDESANFTEFGPLRICKSSGSETFRRRSAEIQSSLSDNVKKTVAVDSDHQSNGCRLISGVDGNSASDSDLRIAQCGMLPSVSRPLDELDRRLSTSCTCHDSTCYVGSELLPSTTCFDVSIGISTDNASVESGFRNHSAAEARVVEHHLLSPLAAADTAAHSDFSDEDEVERPYSEMSLRDVYQELEREAKAKPFHIPISVSNVIPYYISSFHRSTAPLSSDLAQNQQEPGDFDNFLEISEPDNNISESQFTDKTPNKPASDNHYDAPVTSTTATCDTLPQDCKSSSKQPATFDLPS